MISAALGEGGGGGGLVNCTLTNIDLAANYLGDYGAIVLGDALEVACAVECLNSIAIQMNRTLPASIYLTTILASMVL